MTFYSWLGQQVDRQDGVGAFARYAIKDRIFPRQARQLNLFLIRYQGMPEQREGVKVAHREWRRVRAEREDATRPTQAVPAEPQA